MAAAPAQAAAVAAAAVCGLSLESYLQIYKALTKNTDKVQAVSPIEECFYRIGDIRQLLALHGVSVSKFNRAEMLQSLKGAVLINPFPKQEEAAQEPDPAAADNLQQNRAGASSSAGTTCLPSPGDLAALGWAEAGAVPRLQQLRLSYSAEAQPAALPVAGTPPPAAAAVAEPAHPQPPPPPAAAMHTHEHAAIASTQQHAPASVAASAPAPAEAAVLRVSADAPAAAASWTQPQPQQQAQAADVAAACSQPPEAAQEAPEDSARSQLLQQTGLLQLAALPIRAHTPWLLQQLQRFALAGAVASDQALPEPAAPAAAAFAGAVVPAGAGLLGRHVGFVLQEEMSVAGPRSTQLALPAGVYEGRVLKFLGSACQPELCEAACPGNHQHYRARVMPPEPLPGEERQAAAVAAQAAAAASGRPVLLILDLHPRLRARCFRDLLGLTSGQLQDAWVLLRAAEEAPPNASAAGQPSKADRVRAGQSCGPQQKRVKA